MIDVAPCKKCIHRFVCGKQVMRKSLEPKGYELHCKFFRDEMDDVKNFAKYLIDKGENGIIHTFDLCDYIQEFEEGLMKK